MALAEAERWAELEKWPEALDAVKRGEGLLAGGGGEVRHRLRELRMDLEMLIGLEEVQLRATYLQREWQEWDAVHDGFATAFAEYGIDVLNLPVEEAAARIRSRDRLASSLSGALDLWSIVSSPKTVEKSSHLRAVAGAVDRDPWRQHVREALKRKDGAALAQLSAAPDLSRQPRNSLIMLQHGLWDCGREDEALKVCRLTQRLHPADFWANYALAYYLYWIPNAGLGEVASFARAAVAARPKSTAAHLLLAMTLRRTGKLDEAIAYHHEALALSPNNPYAHHDFGRTLHRQQKYDEALAAFQKAIDLLPTNHHAYKYRGDTLWELKRFDEAIADFRRATELSPNGPPFAVPAYLALANALFARNRHADAIEALRRYVQSYPHDFNGFMRLANAVRAHMTPDEAISYIEAFNQQFPSNADIQYHIAFTFTDMGKPDKALIFFNRALEINPNNSHVLSGLAWALERLGRYDDAILCHDKAIAIEPKNHWAYIGLANTRRVQRNLDAAAAALRRATDVVESNRAHAFPRLLITSAWLDLGKYKEAFLQGRMVQRTIPQFAGSDNFSDYERVCKEHLDQVVRRLASDPSPHARDPSLAVELAREALRFNAPPDLWKTLGVAQYRAGGYTAAVVAAEESVKLRKGGDATDWFVLAMANWQLGNRAEARGWYDKAIAWMNKRKLDDAELMQLRAEASTLLDVTAIGKLEVGPPPRVEP